MIGRLSGVLAEIEEDNALVDVNGVGYEVFIPRRLIDRLTIGDSLVLYIHVSVVNEVQHLYGFDTAVDRLVFRKLLSVNRLGPKLAAALISELRGSDVATAVQAGDSATLSAVPGIGKKVSESIVFSLRDEVSKWHLPVDESATALRTEPIGSSPVRVQAIVALRQLGFQRNEAEQAVESAHEEGLDVSELTQRALRLVGTRI